MPKKELTMETRLLLAFVLVGIVLVGWNYIYKPPPLPVTPATQGALPAAATDNVPKPAPAAPPPPVADLPGQVQASQAEEFDIETDLYRVRFSNQGAVVRSWILKQYKDSTGKPLDLVNTYGAFGSVGRERYNVIFEGTDAEAPNQTAVWKPYRYAALPVELDEKPPQVAPYQPRLDWQIWFASMSRPEQYPWTLHLIWKLLDNDPETLSLFRGNPFPGKPPRYIRAMLYRYEFAPAGNPEGNWWKREELGLWLPPLTANDPRLISFLRQAGWLQSTNAPGP